MELNERVNAALGWFLGALAIFMALPMIFLSFMSALPYLIIALMLLPPAREYAYSITKKTISTKARVISIIALIILSGYFSAMSDDKAAKENAAIEAQKQADNLASIKQKNADYFNQNSVSILAHVQKLIDDKNYREALGVTSKYSSSKNAELLKLHDIAVEQNKKGETEIVLAEIAKTPETDLTKLDKLYAQLVSINPQSTEYKEKHQATLDRIELKKAKELAAQQQAKQQQEAEKNKFGAPPVFLRWNGSYQEVTSYLKEIANDPDSIEIDGCTEVYKNDQGWLVGCNYRGRNAFNAVIRQSNWFTIVHGKVIAMHDYSKYER